LPQLIPATLQFCDDSISPPMTDLSATMMLWDFLHLALRRPSGQHLVAVLKIALKAAPLLVLLRLLQWTGRLTDAHQELRVQGNRPHSPRNRRLSVSNLKAVPEHEALKT